MKNDLQLNDLRRQLREHGYQPVPVTGPNQTLTGGQKGGKAVLLPDWPNVCRDATLTEISLWSTKYPNWTNTGLLCGKIVAIDIDVNDVELADAIEALARKQLGQNGLCRVGQNPKRMLVYRTREPFSKKVTDEFTLPSGAKAQVEVLGEGQQFVGFGRHPQAGTVYTWIGHSPLDTPLDQLPEVEQSSVVEFLEGASQCLSKGGANSHRKKLFFNQLPSVHDITEEAKVSEALSYVPNHDLHYEDWLRIGFAIHNGLGSSGRDIWMTWSAQSLKDDPRETDNTWKSFSNNHASPVTVGTLFHIAKTNGWQPSGLKKFSTIHTADDAKKPRLLVEPASPDITVKAIGILLEETGGLYDRAGPARIVKAGNDHPCRIQNLTPDSLRLLAHQRSRPYSVKQQEDGSAIERPVKLPLDVARMYLEGGDHNNLPPINGITSAPLLKANGDVITGDGYDIASGMYRVNVPEINYLIPEYPTKLQAEEALFTVRQAFKTFCFADAQREQDLEEPCVVVVIDRPPGGDEGAFLHALLTAVCRPSLELAPGVLITASSVSGAGSGKGLLARCISLIAFGQHPHAVTGGGNREETEKRITSELVEGGPTLFLDNLNNTSFRSDQLASAITERLARVRIFGKTEMALINAKALVMLTGNGLSVSEDLARRFLQIELDPGVEDAEARRFRHDPASDVLERRSKLLASLLTIWRWGRQNTLKKGQPLGSFETWCSWVRDPLMALGCPDPVERVQEVKRQDSERQDTLEVFNRWYECHANTWVKQAKLDTSVVELLDPRGRGKNALSRRLQSLAGTRLAGFHLERHKPDARWSPLEYRLLCSDLCSTNESHWGHRPERGRLNTSLPHDPDDPYEIGDFEQKAIDANTLNEEIWQ